MKKQGWSTSSIALILASMCIAVPFGGAQSTERSSKRTQAQSPAPTSSGDAKFDQMVKQAEEARESDRIQDGIHLYRQALQIRPSWGEGWWYLGTLLYDSDQYEEARDAFRRLVPMQSKNGAIFAMLGLCGFQLRDYERALVDLQKARLLGLGNNQELNSVTRYHAAILLTRFEQYEIGYDALREFARENNASPTVIEAFGLNLLRMPYLPSEVPPQKREQVLMGGWAAYHMASRRPNEARNQFEKLIESYPEVHNVHYAYGVFLLLENPDRALEEFQRELQLTPTHVPSLLQLAFEYIKRGEFKLGLPFAEEGVRLSPDSFPGRNALGRILLETGNVTRAIQELEEGVKLAPDSPEMRFALARAYARAGRKQDAERERATFLRLDKMQRTLRQGPQSVGGAQAKPDNEPPC